MAKGNKQPTYTEALAEIEKILTRIGGENPDIDTLAADVKRATELIGTCRERLHKAEQEVNRILGPKEE